MAAREAATAILSALRCVGVLAPALDKAFQVEAFEAHVLPHRVQPAPVQASRERPDAQKDLGDEAVPVLPREALETEHEPGQRVKTTFFFKSFPAITSSK
jgi:hypothetical protein